MQKLLSIAYLDLFVLTHHNLMSLSILTWSDFLSWLVYCLSIVYLDSSWLDVTLYLDLKSLSILTGLRVNFYWKLIMGTPGMRKLLSILYLDSSWLDVTLHLDLKSLSIFTDLLPSYCLFWLIVVWSHSLSWLLEASCPKIQRIEWERERERESSVCVCVHVCVCVCAFQRKAANLICRSLSPRALM